MLKDLDKKNISINKVLKNTMIKTTNQCKKIAKQKVPKKDGNLARSIHSEVKFNTANEIEGIVETNCEYAAYVEYGTGQRGMATNTNPEVEVSYSADWSGQNAKPYMYPAYLETKEKFVEILKKEIKTVIEEK